MSKAITYLAKVAAYGITLVFIYLMTDQIYYMVTEGGIPWLLAIVILLVPAMCHPQSEKPAKASDQEESNDSI